MYTCVFLHFTTVTLDEVLSRALTCTGPLGRTYVLDVKYCGMCSNDVLVLALVSDVEYQVASRTSVTDTWTGSYVFCITFCKISGIMKDGFLRSIPQTYMQTCSTS